MVTMKERRNNPPLIAKWLFKRMTSYQESYSIVGDVEEVFYMVYRKNGYSRAFAWYWYQCIISLFKYSKCILQWGMEMFKNYLKSAFRNVIKHKSFSLINISGLAIGMACGILILLWVTDELSYDRFHEKADRTYRIAVKGTLNNTNMEYTLTPPILYKTLINEYPEVQDAVRIWSFRNIITVSFENKSFIENNILAVDSTFFNVFTFPLIRGDSRSALREPFSTVITSSTAIKYFGDKNPLNKTLTINNRDFSVTGVIEDVPENSHFHFDMLTSLSTYGFDEDNNWWNHMVKTYIVLQEDYPREQLIAKFSGLLLEKLGELRPGDNWSYYLQPLTGIHLNSNIGFEFEPNGDITYIYFFSIIVVLIVIIASINFMNLATAKSENRAKEIGIRKVVGSSKSLIIKQYLTESIFTALLALIVALILVHLLLPFFSSMTGKHLELQYFGTLFAIPLLIGFAIVVGIISGIYPAFFLSSFNTIYVLKGNTPGSSKGRRPLLRNSLVVMQFSISIILFISTFLVNNQLQYIQTKNLGFSKEHVFVIKNSQALGEKSDIFKQELLKNSNIIDVTGANSLPGDVFQNVAMKPEGKETVGLNIDCVDYDFLKTFKMELVQGRFFSRDFISDSSAIILNEAAVNLLEWKEPIGKRISTFNVIGVIKDIHYESFRQEIKPMAFLHLSSRASRTWTGYSEKLIAARIQSEDSETTLNYIRSTWQNFAPAFDLDYSFFDEDFALLHKNEQQTKIIFFLFSIIAVFISCLGLIGLASFLAQKRRKEIGIRKVLGSSVMSIIALLVKDFTALVILANIIAWPTGYYVMDKWLDNFAYRTDIGWSIFLVSSLLAFLIVVITVSFQSIRAARVNPAETLRFE